MRLVVKTVTKQELEVNIDDDVSVGDLKIKIDEEHGYTKDGMKLVFKGKMLEDAQSLKDSGLTENESIVMVAKKRTNVPTKEAAPAAAQPSGAPAATPAPAAPEATPAATTEAPVTESPTPAPAAPAPTDATSTPAPQAPVAGSGDSFFATGNEVDSAVAQLIEITGCDAPTAQRALRAAFNNPDRAVEYIFSGSIPNVDVPAGGNAGGARPQGQAQPDAHADAMGEDGDEGDDAEGQAEFAQLMQAAQAQGLSPEQMMAALQAMMQQRGGGGPAESALVQALRSVPQFPQIRQIILQQPAMMEAILQQVQQTNPQLHQLIRENAQEFMNILQNGLPAPGAAAPGGFPLPGAPQGGAPGGAPAGAPPGAAVIQLTPDEAAAVGRLQTLGFPRHAALEAYLACDKNEEAAANYLFDNAAEFG